MNNIVCLIGPTASGKTALSLELASRFPLEIISVDSAMIYRDMTIGTAKPTITELNGVPHHLIDICNPNEVFSVAEFCQMATYLCHDILKRGKIPLLVGGTMMYFHALQNGLAVLPKADPKVRAYLVKEAYEKGWPYLHDCLANIDPESAARIHQHDAKRIERALEVYYLTQQPMSQLQKQTASHDFSFRNFLLCPIERSWLHERIEMRLQHMLNLGFIDEVEQLITKWQLTYDMPALRCVGYKQAFEYLHRACTYSEFYQKALAATRQLAKRQLTWLRHHFNGSHIACDDIKECNQGVARIIEILDNTASYY
ncbi:MAG: tRNA (adenosine(37)-N6)-dimethylallyltransferase MiaA [Legionellaceae bacterium]|nr:tRNA (adenosine(37)-N6)-dimethylallyltransferase MiaA [Legionellaceae bacterium]|tara:strand:- start:5803 stop:6741 length:939 start_codon:yes stop_codon:yes gene_type:complete